MIIRFLLYLTAAKRALSKSATAWKLLGARKRKESGTASQTRTSSHSSHSQGVARCLIAPSGVEPRLEQHQQASRVSSLWVNKQLLGGRRP